MGTSENNAKQSLDTISNRLNNFPGAQESNMFKDIYFLYGDKNEVDESDLTCNRRKRMRNQRNNEPRRDENLSRDFSRRGRGGGRSQNDEISFTYNC